MLDIKGRLLNIGARVKLDRPDHSYRVGPNNPAVSTKYECVGTLVDDYIVDWDNGTSNSYKDGELVDTDYPCKSIWD